MALTILIFVPDLFFQARLETAARRMNLKVLKAEGWKDALEAAIKSPPAGSVVDLSAPAGAGVFRFLDRVKSQKTLSDMRTLGFVDHVRADLAEKARKAGCAAVVSKNALSMDTAGYLRRMTAHAAPPPPPMPRPPGRPPKGQEKGGPAKAQAAPPPPPKAAPPAKAPAKAPAKPPAKPVGKARPSRKDEEE
ncbi:MAG TPA: hypothetical protein VFS92_03175 [Planctomycetota bacterium]|nr:hypothetical protein [Planctomycetota bacterium]